MKLVLPCGALAALCSPALPQSIDWITVDRQDSRIVAAPDLGLSDPQEKDYAWGDLDRDGRIDLVVVRKEPWTTPGAFPNVLFMNEDGSLVDRTATYAAASDVPGDQGFLTPTNDRDVVLTDVDLDGWLDVVTAPTLSPGQPKHISHPRVYVNLGVDANGDWRGLLYEDARTPDWGTHANFCGVDAGDVTGDGYPDLYFSHYDAGAAVDLNDRLLVNDGTGFFVDESAQRFTGNMLASGFGTSTSIADLNGDGAADVLDGEAFLVKALYNDPANVGFFKIQDTPYQGSSYHVNTGDLNRDGKVDMVVSDDGLDRYLLNEGNDALGRVTWSPAHNYNVDGGIGSNNLIVDVDGDGWAESLHCDVDVDIPGCVSRLHLYHNRGGAVGGFVTLFEESGAGSVGAAGMSAGALGGAHDVAVFDVDGDGAKDFVLGHCGGTRLWITVDGADLGQSYCGPAVPNSTGLPGVITARGNLVAAENDLVLSARQLPPQQFGYFLVSRTQGLVVAPPGSQGNLCLGGTIGRYANQAQGTGAAGELRLRLDLEAMPPPVQPQVHAGETWSFQAWFRDKNPNATSNFTDGRELTFL